MKINRLKKFIVRYAWTGSLIGFAVGFLFGPGIVWQVFDFRLKTRSSVLEQVKTEEDLYERRQSLQGEISSSISQYIPIRNNYFLRKKDYQPIQTDKEIEAGKESDYQIQNEFNITKLKLVSLIDEFNEIEVNLSSIESRLPHFFALSLPPIAPHIIGITNNFISPGRFLSVLQIEPPPEDPLVIDVEKDLQNLFQQHGHKYPSDNNWIDVNAGAYDLTNSGYKIYFRTPNGDHWTVAATLPGTNNNWTFITTN